MTATTLERRRAMLKAIDDLWQQVTHLHEATMDDEIGHAAFSSLWAALCAQAALIKISIDVEKMRGK